MISVDLTWLHVLVAAAVLYYAALFVEAVLRRTHASSGDLATSSATSERSPFVVLVIPARNEELVLDDTLCNLDRLSYPLRLVLVMNDGSSDATAAVAGRWNSPSVLSVDRDASVAGGGKGAVLNHAFQVVNEMLEDGDPRFLGRDASSVILGVIDADGRLEAGAMEHILPYFDDPGIGGVQIGVRISNAQHSLLARLQDIEFLGFSALMQSARDPLGSVALGGNGQFVRLSALRTIGEQPWTRCLTEDLDLGLSLAKLGWRLRYCPDTHVAQQGLTSIWPLLRQRTRWTQGHYQCWSHLPALARNRMLSRRTRLDLMVYLLAVAFVVLIFAGLTIGVASLVGLVQVRALAFDWMPDAQVRAAMVELVAFVPCAAFLLVYQRRAQVPLATWKVPAFGLALSAYGYLFIISHFWAWFRLLTGRNDWTKTPRTHAQETPKRPRVIWWQM